VETTTESTRCGHGFDSNRTIPIELELSSEELDKSFKLEFSKEVLDKAFELEEMEELEAGNATEEKF